jgi:hypothetical protein
MIARHFGAGNRRRTHAMYKRRLTLGDPPPFQFSLRALMRAVAVVAVVCGFSVCVGQPGLIAVALLPAAAWLLWRQFLLSPTGLIAGLLALEWITLLGIVLHLVGLDLLMLIEDLPSLLLKFEAWFVHVPAVLTAVSSAAFALAAWRSPEPRVNAVAAVCAVCLPVLWLMAAGAMGRWSWDHREADRSPAVMQVVADVETVRLRLGRLPVDQSELERELGRPLAVHAAGGDFPERMYYHFTTPARYVLSLGYWSSSFHYDSAEPDRGWHRD